MDSREAATPEPTPRQTRLEKVNSGLVARLETVLRTTRTFPDWSVGWNERCPYDSGAAGLVPDWFRTVRTGIKKTA